jgi:hypothetical protein
MNRGILVIGIASIVIALVNVFASVIFVVLACFDSCPSTLTSIGYAPQFILIPFVALSPALGIILVGWIWEMIELRRVGARGTLVFVAVFPLITLVAIMIATFIAAASEGVAPLDFTPIHLWMGEFALALWPLLVSIVAFTRRQRSVGQVTVHVDAPGDHQVSRQPGKEG